MNTITKSIITKAQQSKCRYKVGAIAFDDKGDILGVSCNKQFLSKTGGSIHAEMVLIRRYKTLIKTIVICRTNKTGNLCPIKPCNNCSKVAEKMGIKIISVEEERRSRDGTTALT
jgi:deoxycytidylate deaminase